MGQEVQQARTEASLTQGQPAHKVYRRQAAISDIENGKMVLDAETLVYLAAALDKPFRYLFPDELLSRTEGNLSNQEREYLTSFRQLTNTDRQRVTKYVSLLAQVRVCEEEGDRQKLRERLESFLASDTTTTDDSPHGDRGME